MTGLTSWMRKYFLSNYFIFYSWLRDLEKKSEAIATASKSSRSSSGRCNTSIKDQVINEKMKVYELLAEQIYIKRRNAAEFEAE